MAVGRRGLYEELLTQALAARLGELAPGLDAQTEPLRRADAPDRIALHLSRLVQRALAMVPDDERVGAGIALARRVVALIDAETSARVTRRRSCERAGDGAAGAGADGTPTGRLERGDRGAADPAADGGHLAALAPAARRPVRRVRRGSRIAAFHPHLFPHLRPVNVQHLGTPRDARLLN